MVNFRFYLLFIHLVCSIEALAFRDVENSEFILELIKKIPDRCLLTVLSDTDFSPLDTGKIKVPFIRVNIIPFLKTSTRIYKWSSDIAKITKNLSCKFFVAYFEMPTIGSPGNFVNFLLGKVSPKSLTQKDYQSWSLFGVIMELSRSHYRDYLHLHYWMIMPETLVEFKIPPKDLLSNSLRLEDNILLFSSSSKNIADILICRVQISLSFSKTPLSAQTKCTRRLKSDLNSISDILKLSKHTRIFMWYGYSPRFGNIPANPFTNNYRVPLNPQEYLVSMVTKKLNLTEYKSLQQYDPIEQSLSLVSYIWGLSRYILLNSEPIEFLTCFTYNPHLSFDFYWKPFSLDIWKTLAVFFIILSGLLHLYVGKCHSNFDFQTWLFYFRYLVDDPVSIPLKLENSLPFLYLAYPWIAVSVIFTVLYSSMLISELNLPIRNDKMKHINDSFCPMNPIRKHNEQFFWRRSIKEANDKKKKITKMTKETLTNLEFHYF